MKRKTPKSSRRTLLAGALVLTACGAPARPQPPAPTANDWTFALNPDGPALDWLFRRVGNELLLVGTDPGGLAGTIALLNPRTGQAHLNALYAFPYSAELQAVRLNDTLVVASPSGVGAWNHTAGDPRWTTFESIAPPFKLTATPAFAWAFDAESVLHRFDLRDGQHATVDLSRTWHAVAASPPGATAWFTVSTTAPGSFSGGRLSAIELRDSAREVGWERTEYYDLGTFSFDGPLLSFVGSGFATARLDLRSGELEETAPDDSFVSRFAAGPWRLAVESVTGEFLTMVRVTATDIVDPDAVVWSRAYPARDVPVSTSFDRASGAVVVCGTQNCAAFAADGELLWTSQLTFWDGDTSCATLFVFPSGVVSDCTNGSARAVTGFAPTPH